MRKLPSMQGQHFLCNLESQRVAENAEKSSDLLRVTARMYQRRNRNPGFPGPGVSYIYILFSI